MLLTILVGTSLAVDAVGYADSETGERSLRGQSISFRTAIE